MNIGVRSVWILVNGVRSVCILVPGQCGYLCQLSVDIGVRSGYVLGCCNFLEIANSCNKKSLGRMLRK